MMVTGAYWDMRLWPSFTEQFFGVESGERRANVRCGKIKGHQALALSVPHSLPQRTESISR